MLGRSLAIFLFSIIALSACVPVSTGRKLASTDNQVGDVGSGSPTGDGSITQDDPFDEHDTVVVKKRVELFQFVDPFDESFKSKITIPKNFGGILYIGGINISSLKDKFIYIRFKFGRDYESVTVPAVVGQAVQGITPKTNVEVLILHMENRPFSYMKLPYDLYDYTDYSTGREPTTDPRDVNLYCRGLNLVDDSSFSGGTSCTQADQACKYAYAKVVDRGLMTNDDPENPGEPLPNSATRLITPTAQQIALNATTLAGDSFTDMAKKCLPDSNQVGGFNTLFNITLGGGTGNISLGDMIHTSDDGKITYQFAGPFQSINVENWSLSGDAVFGKYGIFEHSYMTPANANFGYGSYLFPRVGKMSLTKGIEYLGSANPFDPKSSIVQDISGDSSWMDGCNIRVSNYDATTNESISSCNVTARVEVIVKDPETGTEEVIVSSKDIKLQLIRESLTDNEGREFLYSAMKTCETNNACGVDECCYNKRCWSKDLITACLDETTGYGDLGIGQSCSSDYQCQSLCCNPSTGTCAVHNPDLEDPVYCGKPPGQSCVAREWCQKQIMTKCFIVKTGTTNTGVDTCTMRCYSVEVFPSCVNGRCVPQAATPPPVFDPEHPDCEKAMTPEEVQEELAGM